MSFVRSSFFPISFCIAVVMALSLVFAELALKTDTAEASGAMSDQITVFSNPAPIAPVDRPNNNAGSNPGLPATNYPSPIVVAGLSGTVTKITVTFAITSTFPDDLDVLLVGPGGQRSLVMSDAGGSGDHTNITYTFDQAAAATMPDNPTAVVPAGTFRPSNFAGLTTTEPGGNDNFPNAGGSMAYTADFNVFNGTNPNGTWNLYVVDDQVIDLNSLPSGWSIDITTGGGGPAADAPVDFNGDGWSDYVVVRNTGGGQGTWYINNSSGGATATQAFAWGLTTTDFFFAEDFDGDLKDDISVWRPGSATTASFYILNSNGFTARVEAFGQTGDDPTVVGDYNNDGKADLAVYRAGVAAGQPSFWYYRTVANGAVNVIQWGSSGDTPAPGDYDGNGSNDFCIQRNAGEQAAFWLALNGPGTTSVTFFGTPTDVVTPGDYDGDGKTDFAVGRPVAGSYVWFWRPSGGGGDQQVAFGNSATDVLTPGDYNGDGKTDQAVWRNGVFWTRDVVSGAVSTFQLGASGDFPVANFNVH